MRRRFKAVIALAMLAGFAVAATAVAGIGDLTPKRCITDRDFGSDECASATDGLTDVRDVAVSPDGRSVYAVSEFDSAIVRFTRNADTGGLQVLGCIEDPGAPDNCATTAQGLGGANDVEVSPDGTTVYVTGGSDEAIVRFARSASGGLTNKGCIADNDAVTACSANARGMEGISSLAISADGQSVYTAAGGDSAIARFNRDPANGKLTYRGCVGDNDSSDDCNNRLGPGLTEVTSVDVSADGLSVYGASFSDNALVRLNRDPATGAVNYKTCVEDDDGGPDTCPTSTAGLGSARGVTVSPDNRSVYVGSNEHALVRFNRNLASGALVPKGCFQDAEDGFDTCTEVPALSGARTPLVPSDGDSLYVAGANDDAIVGFRRASDGTLNFDECVQDDDGASGVECAKSSEGLDFVQGLAIEGTDGSLYSAAQSDSAVLHLLRERQAG